MLMQGRRQKNFRGGGEGAAEKRPKNGKLILLSLFQGGEGGNGKSPKIAKKHRKIAFFSLYLLYLYHV